MTRPARPARPRRLRVLLMYGNGGGGHKASAAAIAAVLRELHAATPEAAPIVEMVDAAAVSGAAAGDWLYNVLLSYNAVSTIELMHSAIQVLMPFALPKLRNSFRAFWAAQPDLACVVSLVPMLNAVFAETLPPSVPLFTVLTDFSHTRSHPWIQHPRQHVVAGTDIGYAQALAAGYLAPDVPGPSHVVTRSSGMVVHPRFYQRASRALRSRRLADMGLHPTLPTLLILFGGAPPTDRVVELVDRFIARQTYSPVNLIVVCSRNKQLFDRLTRRKARNAAQHLFITGFTNDIPLFMQMSDLLIGKPGPGVVSEAFVSRLPCVLVTGVAESHVMKQEKDVLDWVRRAGIGMVVRTPEDAAKITVSQMASMKEHITVQNENRAVFQVGELILNALGYGLPLKNDDEEVEENPSHSAQLPQEADIGDMDLTGEVPQSSVSSARKYISMSMPSELGIAGDSGDFQREQGPTARRSSNSLSPTTITALPSRGSEGGKQETLPNSRASYDLGKKRSGTQRTY